jgi:hypothetical protein
MLHYKIQLGYANVFFTDPRPGKQINFKNSSLNSCKIFIVYLHLSNHTHTKKPKRRFSTVVFY